MYSNRNNKRLLISLVGTIFFSALLLGGLLLRSSFFVQPSPRTSLLMSAPEEEIATELPPNLMGTTQTQLPALTESPQPAPNEIASALSANTANTPPDNPLATLALSTADVALTNPTNDTALKLDGAYGRKRDAEIPPATEIAITATEQPEPEAALQTQAAPETLAANPAQTVLPPETTANNNPETVNEGEAPPEPEEIALHNEPNLAEARTQTSGKKTGWIYAGQFTNQQWQSMGLKLSDPQRLPEQGQTYTLNWGANIRPAPPGARSDPNQPTALSEPVGYLAENQTVKILTVKPSGKQGHIWLEVEY